MKRKKPGASLIVVIVIFMAVAIVSMAMLSLIAGNYKARVMDSKRIENLYASDSGLDATYNIIAKTFDAAAKYGYYQVEALKRNDRSNKGPNDEKYKNIEYEITVLKAEILILEAEISALQEAKKEPDSDIIQINLQIEEKRNLITEKELLIEEDEQLKLILINEEFKRSFKNFIAKTTNVGVGEIAPDKLEISIEERKFVSEVVADNSNNIDFQEEIIEFGIQDIEGNLPELDGEVSEPANVLGSLDELVKLKDGHYDYVKNLQIIKSAKQNYNISVTSTFTSGVNVSVTSTNEKKLQAKYRMLVPNYKDIFFGNYTGGLHDYLALLNRALTIGGDMAVEKAELTVDKGEAFVQGNSDKAELDKVYGKYVGGISINNSENVLFNNNLITRGTFNIRNDTNAIVEGNLYARNIYAGAADGGYSDNSNFSANREAVIDNDLSIKATDTNMTIADFYGINDKNISYDDSKGNLINNSYADADSSYKARTSSSIIINSYGGNESSSSVVIRNKAYIMGTAHIATAGEYQTGESTAVKGNYEAYSIPLDLSENFKYDEPLQLLDEGNVFKKSEHFKKYWEEIKPNSVNSGGIFFSHPEKIYSIGAVVYKANGIGKVIASRYSADLEMDSGIITQKRIEYASKVYRFGQTATIGDYNYLGADAIPVSSLMNLSGLPLEYDLDEAIEASGEKALFNNYSDITLIIQGNNVSTEKEYLDSDGNEVVNKKIIKGNSINAVIATAGDVIIDGDVTLNGSIIANGNLNVSGNVAINYDEEVIGRIQKQNLELFENVFGGNIISNQQFNGMETVLKDTKYNLKNFLETKLWKIIK